MEFTGGPDSFFGALCTPEHYRVIQKYLDKVEGPRPTPPPNSLELTDADYLRVIPRHFEMSITGDVTPGFPIRRKGKATQ